MRSSQLAVPELGSVEVKGMTREAFLVRGAIGAGAVYGLSAVTPFVRTALAQEGMEPVDVLKFALTLEALEAAFYQRALQELRGLSGDVKEIATTLRADEKEHVEALTRAIRDLGGRPDKPPQLDFGDAYSSTDAFLRLAQTFEDTGVGAYNGAAPALQQNDDLLSTAGAIVQVEGRHAAAIRQLRDQPITDGAFDKGIPRDQVRSRVKPFIKS